MWSRGYATSPKPPHQQQRWRARCPLLGPARPQLAPPRQPRRASPRPTPPFGLGVPSCFPWKRVRLLYRGPHICLKPAQCLIWDRSAPLGPLTAKARMALAPGPNMGVPFFEINPKMTHRRLADLGPPPVNDLRHCANLSTGRSPPTERLCSRPALEPPEPAFSRPSAARSPLTRG